MMQKKRKKRLVENHDQEVETISAEVTNKNQSKKHQNAVERNTETHPLEAIHTLLQNQAVAHQDLEDLHEGVRTVAKNDNIASIVAMMKGFVQKTEKDNATTNSAK